MTSKTMEPGRERSKKQLPKISIENMRLNYSTIKIYSIVHNTNIIRRKKTRLTQKLKKKNIDEKYPIKQPFNRFQIKHDSAIRKITMKADFKKVKKLIKNSESNKNCQSIKQVRVTITVLTLGQITDTVEDAL